ncbi:MAG: gluconate transporter [Saprospiraceae bacterium]|nr:gluconate transporter [Saprospiraceae bacterium]
MDSTVTHWPIIVLLIGIAAVVILIAVFKIHAFLSLICASVVVGVLTQQLPGQYSNHYVRAVELSMTEFGVVAGKIAFVIALAAILGVALTMSGAAEKIVIKFIGLLGEKLAPIALLISGFVLSIPVFFDTVFFLLIPIAYSMGQKIRKDYVLFVMAISAGAAITHSLVPPTPGPLVMAEDLSLNLGLVIVVGFLAGILPAIVAYLFAKRLSKRIPIEPPVMQDEAMEEPLSSLPPFGLAILPIIVPLILIINSSALEYFAGENETQGTVATFWHFIGNKNMAMLLGTILALWLLAKQKGWGIKQVGQSLEKPLEIAGIIILITSAGGAFGGMIKHSGIGDWIKGLALGGIELNYVLLAWLVAAVMKIAQGSGTVAMITTAGIMVTLTTGIDLPYHPVYLLLAIGFGSMFISWMNDSGFWVVCKMSGFSEKQTLQTWTVTLGLIGLVGLIQVLILSKVIPLV